MIEPIQKLQEAPCAVCFRDAEACVCLECPECGVHGDPLCHERHGLPHGDDQAVDRFAAAMKAKLAQKRAEGRGGWADPMQCQWETLALMLVEHVAKGDPVDVANFAMMLHQREAPRSILSWAAAEKRARP